MSDQPELLFTMDANYKYEVVSGASGSHWVSTQLEPRVVRAGNDGKAKHGVARRSGEIDTSATSSGLRDAVNGILSSFRPK